MICHNSFIFLTFMFILYRCLIEHNAKKVTIQIKIARHKISKIIVYLIQNTYEMRNNLQNYKEYLRRYYESNFSFTKNNTKINTTDRENKFRQSLAKNILWILWIMVKTRSSIRHKRHRRFACECQECPHSKKYVWHNLNILKHKKIHCW